MTVKPRTASLAVALSALGFGVMVVFAKRVSFRLPGPEVAWLRFLVGALACGLATLRRPLAFANKRLLVLRGLMGGSAVLVFFLAVEHLHVGVATLLNYTAPLWATLWAAVFLREHPKRLTLVAMAVAFAGVVLVLTGREALRGMDLRWQLVGVLSGVLSGASVAVIRELRRTDGSWEIFAAFNLGGLVVCAPQALGQWVSPTPFEWSLLVLVGLLSVGAQLALTWALRYATTAGSGVLMQLTPVAAFVGGALAFGDTIPLQSLVGAGIAVVGVGWGAYLGSVPDEDG
ncbi:MAG: DMT family transporter [Deltaproteobacteria bacterium]|nr:DMT family transporter [Deltaproteobacteria bacterium]